MTPSEKRKFLRRDALHLLDYLIIDKDGNQSDYSMARTLDVSINGIKIETVRPIPDQSRLIITLGIEENLVDITGHYIHSSEADDRYVSGIEFEKVSADNRKILRKYISEYEARKEALLQQEFPPNAQMHSA